MCGIFASISRKQEALAPSEAILHLLKRRGPDCVGSVRRTVSSPIEEDVRAPHIPVHLGFTSTVLSLRGDDIVNQPLTDKTSDSLLCWNGEAWKIDGRVVQDNDGVEVFRSLLACVSGSTGQQHASDYNDLPASTEGAIYAFLKSISGPFAFVFYDSTYKRIFFGRDRLGRRSLLLRNGEDGELMISSVSEPSSDEPWIEVDADGVYVLDLESLAAPVSNCQWPIASVNRQHLPVNQTMLDADSKIIADLKSYLRHALELRVCNIPLPMVADREVNRTCSQERVAVLFSGGIDCTLLARLMHEVLAPGQPIALINAAFENPRKVAARARSAAGTRTEPKAPDLSNYDLCPDRITGLSSFAELRATCPTREWKFVSVNVPYEEFVVHKQQVISLMYPHDTEMDLSIAIALYFAARGRGVLKSEADSRPYATPARVFVSGLGADELFAGYTRHATAFARHGSTGLLDQLELDIGRIGRRNLGRDDRAISHWAREIRYPYLDEELVAWTLARPWWQKCSFGLLEPNQAATSLDSGKHILRLLARRLGMPAVAQEGKRAIQFGACTAKMESGRSKGTHRIAR